MVFADPVTREIATNQPAPDAPRPQALGFANAAMLWGETRWTILVWPMVAKMDEPERARVMLHELFHRIQPEIGLFVAEGQNDHLDSLDGRYWMRLEWRALARALDAAGTERTVATRDALAFRAARRAAFPGAAANERLLEINEGLAQYTGTVAAVRTAGAAVADAIQQLMEIEMTPSFVRTFAYPSIAAYGLLLDTVSPDWTRRIRSTDDVGELLMRAATLEPSADAAAAALRYEGAALRAAEITREEDQRARVAAYRQKFVDGPVVLLPNGRSNSFVTTGITPIPGAGSVYPSFRTTGDWGSLVASAVLLATDRTTLTLAGPFTTDGATLFGDGWTLALAGGWAVRPGLRAGDFVIAR